MKNVLIAIGLVIIMIISSLILFTVYERNTRQNELEEALAVAVEQTLSNMKIDKNYAVNTEEEFLADFSQNLILAIESDSDIDVNVLALDIDKGLFDVEVVQTYRQPNGSEGTVSYRKTVILEEYIQPEPSYYYVQFMYERENESGDFEAYKTFSICENSLVIVPSVEPTQKGHSFVGWSTEKPSSENDYGNDTLLDTTNEDERPIVDKDLVYYAVFE